MVQVQMREVGRDEAPPLSSRNRGALIAPGLAQGLATGQWRKQCHQASQQSETVPAIAIKRS